MDYASSLIAQFASYLQTVRHLSAGTARTYARDLASYCAFARGTETEEFDNDALLKRTTVLSLRAFMNSLAAEGYKVSSQHRKESAMQTFYKWVERQGHMSINPIRHYVHTQLPRLPKRVIDQDQLAKLLAAPDTTTFRGARDLLMLLLFCETGIKVGELTGLNVGDVATSNDVWSIVIGGKHPRSLILNTATATAARKYLAMLTKMQRGSTDPLFINRRINRHSQRMSVRNVGRRLTRHLKEAGVQGTINASILRHTFVRQNIVRGTSAAEIQKNIGYPNPRAFRSEYGALLNQPTL